jgi:hypothetical protein
MAARKKLPSSIEAEVLVQSRRRCCVCYGLNHDDGVKKGQIAHLDQNRDNNDIENLAFLCFEHHDEYDSSTTQSKGLTQTEIMQYREELLYKFSNWSTNLRRDELLNFLAFQTDIDAMATAAIKVGDSIVFYGEEHAFDVLITDTIDYSDGDLIVPHIFALDHFASWGWLTHTEEEREIQGDMRIFISVQRKGICDHVAKRILENRRKRGESDESLMHLAKYRGWVPPP